MCNTCQDPTSIWTSSGCSSCGDTTSGDNFNELYSSYYAKLSSLIGGKFWPGLGLPAAQFPAVDSNQYSHYLDVATGFIYLYNLASGNWLFEYSLAPFTQSIISSYLQAGTNISLTPLTNGLQINANVPATATSSVSAGYYAIVVPTTTGINTDYHVSFVLPSGVIANPTLDEVTFFGGITNNNVSLGGSIAIPNSYGPMPAISNFHSLAIDSSTSTVVAIPGQQIINGAAGSTPPTTGAFNRGDIYIAG